MIAAACFSAYVGHEGERDSKVLLSAYKAIKGTALDDCGACHKSGKVPDPQKPGAKKDSNSCDYCHAIMMEAKKPAKLTLNRYGADFMAAGRNAAALRSIEKKDSDGDGYSNIAEIKALTQPGVPTDVPTEVPAPDITLSQNDLQKKIKPVTRWVFLNSTKSRSGDTYSKWKGFRLSDVLAAAGASKKTVSVDIISIDGYMKTYPIGDLKKMYPQGAPAAGLGKDKLGDCGWVSYGPGVRLDGKPLPPAEILLAFEENGKALEPAAIDESSGRLEGDGPYRLITPQKKIVPPDLPQFADAACPAKVPAKHRFHGDYDHNAGDAIRAVSAIRVNPMPKGTRDPDWRQNAQKRLKTQSIIVFGNIK